ncbi:MAG: hypothetical protein IT449_06425 [Phycisphaerales bacterium]|nr:hypothetical protein [Phycisphaerales bacterium]
MEHPKTTRGQRITLWCLMIGILVPAGLGFATKIYEFARAVLSERETQFTLVPLANYFLATLGFLCLFVWAIRHGMLRDVEAPKFSLLEREEQLEAWDHRKESHS